MEAQEVGTSAKEFSILIEDFSDEFQIVDNQTLCRAECERVNVAEFFG